VRDESPRIDPAVRELAVLSALAAVGCGLAAAQGDCDEALKTIRRYAVEICHLRRREGAGGKAPARRAPTPGGSGRLYAR